jgi:hypothetical protein
MRDSSLKTSGNMALPPAPGLKTSAFRGDAPRFRKKQVSPGSLRPQEPVYQIF